MILDSAMSILWIVTYTLVLIGTIRLQYPLISPLTQAVVAPLEFAMLIFLLVAGSFGFDYISAGYLYWAIIEILIIIVILKGGYIKRKYIVPYIMLVAMITVVMTTVIISSRFTIFYCHLNSVIGDMIWLAFILRDKKYPMKAVTLATFTTKFLADVLAVPVYFGCSIWIVSFMCILLPILDFTFILIYFVRRSKQVRGKEPECGIETG